jgi:hypothetical protein
MTGIKGSPIVPAWHAAAAPSADRRRPRYNERTGFWETEVIKDTWVPVPPGALAPTPSPDGNYHVCECAGTSRCFFRPGQSNATVRSSLA